MFPKKGKFFPDRRCRPGTEVSYAESIGKVLLDELSTNDLSIKIVQGWTGASERTVKNWLAGRAGPNGPYLLCILRHSDKVLAEVLWLAGRERIATGVHMIEMRDCLAATLARIDHIAAKAGGSGPTPAGSSSKRRAQPPSR